jgi:hypothetical protein
MIESCSKVPKQQWRHICPPTLPGIFLLITSHTSC